MPTDNTAVFELVQEIEKLVHNLPFDGSSLGNARRAELVRNAERLAIAAREPAENLYFQSTQTAQNSAMRTAIDMGVFEKIPSSGSGINVSDLATSLKVDERLLRLGVYTMPEFLKSTNYQNPTDYSKGAFQYGHRTKLGPFEYVKEDPERAKVYNSAMQSLATIGDAKRSAGSYPFSGELGKEDIRDTDVAIVDVGGGNGQALKAIKEAFSRLKGRMVLQDMPGVIEDAEAGGLPSFIEPMAASFYYRQPVEGALIYHFRRIFHDWSDDVSLRILRNTVPAMSSHSRILITDAVVPEMDAPRHTALQGINMMSFGGMERTRLQWENLLQEAGLSIKRFWAEEGNFAQYD